MATLAARYRHVPLESPERQIRLLSVLPSTIKMKAKYELTTYILGGSRTPHFYAISYEWGPAEPKHQIDIDDKVFFIRSNIKDCLERLGSSDEGFYRPVWIDAICIDQSNIAERNAQVKVMGSIYASAKLVIAWFGRQAPANGSLTETEWNLKDWQASTEYKALVNHSEEHSDSVNHSHHISTPPLLSLAEPYGTVWSCLRSLCEQPYWLRLWIVQEVIKSPKLLLMWGDEQIPWDVLGAAFHTIELNKLYIRTSEARFAPWDVIANSTPYKVWLQRDGPHPQRSLLELMDTYRDSDCSVPHDKAYALTGISTDSDQLQVDYDKSLPDLYVDLMELDKNNQPLKFSRLILSALGLDSHMLLMGPGATALRGKTVSCRGRQVGRVDATKAIGMDAAPFNVHADVLELLLMASALLSEDIIDRITAWAQKMHQALRRNTRPSQQDLCFFWLSSNQLGIGLDTMSPDQTVVCLPNAVRTGEDFFMRFDDLDFAGEDSGSPTIDSRSPSLSSPRRSYSTLFSEPSTELVTRVWLSDVQLDRKASTTAGTDTGQATVSLQMPLSDIVAINHLLYIELEPTEDSLPELRVRRQHTQSDAPRRRNTRESSISDVIDQAMSSPSKTLSKCSTWPTSTAGDTFVDALSRDLREKLFASDPSSLNSPE